MSHDVVYFKSILNYILNYSRIFWLIVHLQTSRDKARDDVRVVETKNDDNGARHAWLSGSFL